MSVVFKKWTEEERRAHARARNHKFQSKKEEWTTLTEKRVKEQERHKKLELKAREAAGEWVSTGKAKPKIETPTPLEKIVKKNGFAALESDEEKEEKEKEKSTPNEYVRKKFNWADDSDDE
jgi:hypothetical protein